MQQVFRPAGLQYLARIARRTDQRRVREFRFSGRHHEREMARWSFQLRLMCFERSYRRGDVPRRVPGQRYSLRLTQYVRF